ncbi:uncharacterized protein LOC142981608 [Anticarsia gemmatalis]|uniref:uncharacterized protein LOC142981608 n=1 Tax=Anticarsia gemmatalis TaxID=129554 RepID=UPI003F77187A
MFSVKLAALFFIVSVAVSCIQAKKKYESDLEKGIHYKHDDKEFVLTAKDAKINGPVEIDIDNGKYKKRVPANHCSTISQSINYPINQCIEIISVLLMSAASIFTQ